MARPTDPRILEALCVFELYRKLGFAAEKIHLTLAKEADAGCDDHGHVCLYVSISLDGQAISEKILSKNEFHVRVDRYPEEETALGPLWIEACEWWNVAPTPELLTLFRASKAMRWASLIMSRMTERGIRWSTGGGGVS